MSGSSASRSTAAAPPRSSQLPTVGPFKAIRVLGEGGMGMVYLAEQSQPLRRQVALKVVRLGISTKQIVARFERERQALAMMNHPHVARVFEAGETEDARPYFVMEYVDGIPVNKYCDAHKLSNRERLDVFLKVCDALQHAHQKGIIHRDIKPSNILVSGPREQPAPKVIDFGIAKAVGQRLTGDTFTTQFGQFVGTPAYMSPEQANPYVEDVDTRTDVYSLGVLLYELLAGVLPFDFTQALEKGSIAEVQKLILEKEPELPSSRLSSLGADSTTVAENHGTEVHRLRRELRGDLDWIVMRALEKDRSRRYATVLDLQRDVERHLRSEPVSAGPPTLRYRAAKFLRRRRVAVVLGVMGLALAASGSIALVSTRSARLAREDSLRETTQRIFFEAQLASLSKPDEAIEKLRRLAEANPEFIEARVQLAYLLHRQNRTKESIEAAEQILDQAPENGPAHLLLASIHRQRNPELAAEHLAQGQKVLPNDQYYSALALPESEAVQAVGLLSELLHEDGGNFDARWSRAWRYFQLDDCEKMLADADFLVQFRPRSPSAWNTLGVALARCERLKEAQPAFTHSLDFGPNNAGTLINRADTLRRLGKFDDALSDCNAAIKAEPGLSGAYAVRSSIHYANGDRVRALADAEEALSLQPSSSLAWVVRGRLLRDAGDLSGALSDLTAAIEDDARDPNLFLERGDLYRLRKSYDAAIADYTFALTIRPALPAALTGRGLAHQYLGALDEAANDFELAITLEPNVAQHYHKRARLHRWIGDLEAAKADHDRAIQLAPKAQDPYAGRAFTFIALGDFEEALLDIEKVISLGPTKSFAYHLWQWEMYSRLNRATQAAEALDAALKAATDDLEESIVTMVGGTESLESVMSKCDIECDRAGAYYYAGISALVSGDDVRAVDFLRQSLNANCVQDAEYDLARLRLKD